MTEDEARTWIDSQFGVSRGTSCARFVDLVVDENQRQNLVSRGSLDTMWERHIVDSAQLVGFGAGLDGAWLDIGTGAGFPGIIIALLTDRPVILVEPRRRRAEFLSAASESLGIAARVEVIASRIEAVNTTAAIISARAVAPLPTLFARAHHVALPGTIWVLPKGQTAREEVEAARRTWHGAFHVERSITESESLIIIAKGVARR